ncbi:MAG: transglutaminase-like domain-containing protein [Verrucomicrobiota bacterium]|jgi:hypothetical protein
MAGRVLCCALLIFLYENISALTLDELKNDPQFNPQNLLGHFRKFKFKFASEVQSPDNFLKNKCGDCDDFAMLASIILREKGYTPRLIAVRLKRFVHVVCYVQETQSILDFNQRKQWKKPFHCEPDLREIANAVAATFGQEWTSASEFTFDRGLKRLVKTVLDDENRAPIPAAPALIQPPLLTRE